MPSPIPDSGSINVDHARPYKLDHGCHKDCNTCSGCGNGMKDCNCSGINTRDNNQLANLNQGGTLYGLNDMGMWSAGNLDQLQLEWAGTDPSSKEYTISTSLPQGLAPSDLSVSVDPRTRLLTMTCQRANHQEQKDEQGTFYVSQDSAAATQRAFTLPDDVEMSGIKATKNNSGGFTLTIPKAQQQQQQQQQQGGVKQITIQ